jgi:transcriptional regulator with AAA-type ATPase domain
MSEELRESVHRLIREAYRSFGDAEELISAFVEVARAATHSRQAAVSLHDPPSPRGAFRHQNPRIAGTGRELHFPIIYQDIELGGLSLLPESRPGDHVAEAGRMVAKTLAYHLKRHEVRALARDLYGQELGLIGTSLSLRRTDHFVERASQGKLPALILGDAGSEAAAVALALHLASPRREEPFVRFNCAACESDGFERQWLSRVREAAGGTLLLNRIEELARPLQPRLCEILESGNAGFRLVATASPGLDELVREGGFYAPLLDQVDFLRLEIEPLRNRREEDLKPLLEHYLAVRSGKAPVRLSAEVLAVCSAYPWPGDVAEVSRITGRLAVMAEDGYVRLQHVAAHAPQLLRPADIVANGLGTAEARDPEPSPISPGHPGGRHPALQRAIDHIADHYQEKLSLCDVAAGAYVSPSHLEHLFRRELRTTFTRFVTRRRIERAQALLIDQPHAAVTAIAGDVGFNDLRHFERMFKSLAGCTPRSFRQRANAAAAESAASAAIFAEPPELK